jgi:hypothetical protein
LPISDERGQLCKLQAIGPEVEKEKKDKNVSSDPRIISMRTVEKVSMSR